MDLFPIFLTKLPPYSFPPKLAITSQTCVGLFFLCGDGGSQERHRESTQIPNLTVPCRIQGWVGEIGPSTLCPWPAPLLLMGLVHPGGDGLAGQLFCTTLSPAGSETDQKAGPEIGKSLG